MEKIIITISREYGSGGRQIGEKVARELGIDFYNRNLIDIVAKESGLAAEYIDRQEERLSSRFIWGPAMSWRLPGAAYAGGYYSNEDKMYITQSNIIRDVAAKGPCVIVGRCADYVLRGYERAMNVFIRADLDSRLERLVHEYGVDAKTAAATAQNTDKGRANYYRHYTDMRWGEMSHYHLAVDSSLYGIEGAVHLIVEAAKIAFHQGK